MIDSYLAARISVSPSERRRPRQRGESAWPQSPPPPTTQLQKPVLPPGHTPLGLSSTSAYVKGANEGTNPPPPPALGLALGRALRLGQCPSGAAEPSLCPNTSAAKVQLWCPSAHSLLLLDQTRSETLRLPPRTQTHKSPGSARQWSPFQGSEKQNPGTSRRWSGTAGRDGVGVRYRGEGKVRSCVGDGRDAVEEHGSLQLGKIREDFLAEAALDLELEF